MGDVRIKRGQLAVAALALRVYDVAPGALAAGAIVVALFAAPWLVAWGL